MEKLARTLFLWKIEVHDQKERVYEMRRWNEALVTNMLPEHVARHFLGSKKRDEVRGPCRLGRGSISSRRQVPGPPAGDSSTPAHQPPRPSQRTFWSLSWSRRGCQAPSPPQGWAGGRARGAVLYLCTVGVIGQGLGPAESTRACVSPGAVQPVL